MGAVEHLVTKDIAIRCVLFGACKVPKVGTPAKVFSFAGLAWAERMFTKAELKKVGVPLWALSGYGDGYGDGDGYGNGYGYGDGDGNGNGGGGR